LHQVGTSFLLIYMMHGHTYIKCENSFVTIQGEKMLTNKRKYPSEERQLHLTAPVSWHPVGT